MITCMELAERRFKTADVAIALGHAGDPSQAQVILNRLQEKRVDSYSELETRIGNRDASSGRERSVGQRGAGRSFSLVDLCWICLWHQLTETMSLSSSIIDKLKSRFVMAEFFTQGNFDVENTQSFHDHVADFLFENREPYLLYIEDKTGQPEYPPFFFGSPPREIAEIPGDAPHVEITDNPMRLQRLFETRARPRGGVVIVITFRSFIQPVLERLKKESKLKEEIPDIPECDQRIHTTRRSLTQPQNELIDILTDTPNLSGDVTVRALSGSIRKIEYQESKSPKGLKPFKALKEESVAGITSYPDKEGNVRKYVVKKRRTY